MSVLPACVSVHHMGAQCPWMTYVGTGNQTYQVLWREANEYAISLSYSIPSNTVIQVLIC